ncbi:MAG: hypothetical protein CMJ40_11220 [Phycisphaerae bacterium]|nr:hypothetical protein [Phycisphaerae bacterium]|tara:strand:- start:1826 stop:2206 length:381 start_codon:yes stop_codon:yes gene_type:complete
MNKPNMALVAIVFGVLLIMQGLAFWLAAGFEAARFTAAIPGFFGVALLLLGILSALLPAIRKHLMHVTILVALLGIAGGIVMVVKSLGAEEVSWSKVWDQGLLAFLCVVYFGYCLASFIRARRSAE